jgi:hypothetical protein
LLIPECPLLILSSVENVQDVLEHYLLGVKRTWRVLMTADFELHMPQLRGKLGRKKEGAIIALLSQRNVEEAARAAGVGARTLYRWMKEQDFDAAYQAARRATFSQSAARMEQMCMAAVTILGKISW